jgi:2-methylisocitrate lyase-like PEP mutase family enzyme
VESPQDRSSHVLAGPGSPDVAPLADVGFRRVSLGMALAQAAYALTRRAPVELLTEGTYGRLAGGQDYEEIDSALRRDATSFS